MSREILRLDSAALCGAALLLPLSAQGLQWVQHAGPQPVVASSAMVFDSARGVAVLCGYDPAGTRFQVWEWDGLVWRDRSADLGALTPRGGFSMVYDPVRGGALLYGGYSSQTGFSDLWKWDGTAWTRLCDACPPGALGDPGLAFDAARGEVVLYGGSLHGSSSCNGIGCYQDATWTWNGATWSPRGAGPHPRGTQGMSYDGARQRVVCWGGEFRGGPCSRWSCDVHEWNGITWSAAPTAPSCPSAPTWRQLPGQAYDTLRRRTVVAGGFDFTINVSLSDAWDWDGTCWTRLPSLPNPRSACGFCYDDRNHRLVLFGGYDTTLQRWHHDTWTLCLPASHSEVGAGCRGAHTASPLLSPTPPRIGQQFCVTVSQLPVHGQPHYMLVGVSRSFWNNTPLPLSMSFLGMAPDCFLRTSIDVATLLLGSPSATWCATIPVSTNLLGSRFYLQAITPGPNGTLSGGAMSNAIEFRIGNC